LANNLEFAHQPVLVREFLELLRLNRPGLRVADLTVGGGGHLKALLTGSPRPSEIFAMDQDPAALAAAKKNLAPFEPIHWQHGNFRLIRERMTAPFDRVFVDLGVSSHQLDVAERGFSFQKEGPLDMRMNPEAGEPISEWLTHCSVEELVETFREFGEEPRAKFFARKLDDARRKRRIATTKDLVEALGSSLTAKDHRGRHPLTRIFQALRMKANDELGALADLLHVIPEILNQGGRAGILTFHSLEDREVKWGLKGRLKAINKKVIQASDEEARVNARSRSAKLRVFEKE
jgi:16S rRNA (cytosine1402-N4)-methyltransferase